jgi:hypothetical protein
VGDLGEPAVVLCDRGTIDGAAYWPGEGDLFTAVGTTLEEQLARYDVVIHLRTPSPQRGYNHRNPLRIESAEEALRADARIFAIWQTHPHRFVVDASPDFLTKATIALGILRSEIPECCRAHLMSALGSPGARA